MSDETYKQPVSLYILSLAELCDRFSYYGVQALLILYLTKTFSLSDIAAYSIYGVYTTLAYATTVAGGIIADRVLGFSKTAAIGACLIIAANILLTFHHLQLIYIGLALLSCATGLFKPSNTSSIGALYSKRDPRREAGFTLLYMFMNLGALAAPAVYGLLSEQNNWNAGFLLSALGMSLVQICIFVNRKRYLSEESNKDIASSLFQKTHSSFSYCIIIFAIILVALFFTIMIQYPMIFGHVLEVFGLLILVGLVIVAFQHPSVERNNIIGLTILSLLSLVFFTCSLQTATSLTLFIERVVDRHLYSWQIPTMAFLSLEPFFIILTAPFISKLWTYLSLTSKEPSATFKVTLGLVLAGTSFGLFGLAATLNHFLNGKMGLFLVVIGNLTLGVGEICVLPVVMSTIVKLAPVKMKATMIGILYFSLAFSGYFSSIIAKIIDHFSRDGIASAGYSHGFFDVSMATLIIAAFMIITTPFINRLLQNSHQ